MKNAITNSKQHSDIVNTHEIWSLQTEKSGTNEHKIICLCRSWLKK